MQIIRLSKLKTIMPMYDIILDCVGLLDTIYAIKIGERGNDSFPRACYTEAYVSELA
jgi:hypothetical protein